MYASHCDLFLVFMFLFLFIFMQIEIPNSTWFNFVQIFLQTVVENEELVLKGSVTGIPRPTVKWYNGKKVIKSGKSVTLTHEEDNVTLTMKKTPKSFANTVKCVGTNPAGEATSEAKVTVQGRFTHLC